jgi:cellulose synthase/poly-beta-1,6-N-acetylglucosamine synthase-like glycosyltransferase
LHFVSSDLAKAKADPHLADRGRGADAQHAPGDGSGGAVVRATRAGDTPLPGTELAVLIPCFNEESTIGRVVDDFRTQLPEAEVFVFDNNSTDASATIARDKGAEVIRSPIQGKGKCRPTHVRHRRCRDIPHRRRRRYVPC